MSLVEKYALTPEEIEQESLRRVEASLQDCPSWSVAERYVVCRIVRAEGDPAIASGVRFSPGAVERGVEALRGGAEVVTDVRMVEVGISKVLLSSLGVRTRCGIDTPQAASRARKENTTRSVAAMRELAPHMDGAVVAVGNAPTALLALLDLAGEGLANPALVIGMPVGFVACIESKEALGRSSLPYISVWDRRGGSSAAAATVNALLSLAARADST